MNFKKVPVEIKNFYDYLNSKDLIKEYNQNQFENLYKSFNQYLLDKKSEWFKKNRNYSDEHICEEIFAFFFDKERIPRLIKYSLFAITKSVERISQNIIEYYLKGEKESFISSVSIVREIVFETVVFLDDATFHIEGSFAGFNWGKRSVASSIEVFNASKMLFHKNILKNTVGDFVIQPASVFMLRQAIELRIKNSLGIDFIVDKKRGFQKITAESFIDFVSSNPDIEFPVKKSIVKKIVNWSNYFIHVGFIPEIWKLEWAHYIIEPLFRPDKLGDLWSVFGSIKIGKTYFDDIESEIKKYVAANNKNVDAEDLVIYKLSHPECLLK